MIFATIHNSRRDGCLVLVHPNHTRALELGRLAPTLQLALENWEEIESELQTRYDLFKKNSQIEGSFELSFNKFMAPLPRSYQFLDASAYLHHVKLARQARGVEFPSLLISSPLMYQGLSHEFDAWNAPVSNEFIDMGLDFEAEMAVITDDVPKGVSTEESLKHVKLITLLNDWSLRKVIASELQKSFGFLQGKPVCSCAPFALTPDELGDHWSEGKVKLPLITTLNDEIFGKPNAGIGMHFDFSQLIEYAAKTRGLCAGTLLGSGTVSNSELDSGSSCIVEKRMLQKMNHETMIDFLQIEDRVQIEMYDLNGVSLFGSIDQVVSS